MGKKRSNAGDKSSNYVDNWFISVDKSSGSCGEQAYKKGLQTYVRAYVDNWPKSVDNSL